MFIKNWINLIMQQVKCDGSMHSAVSGIELRVKQHWSTGPAEIWHLRLREKKYMRILLVRSAEVILSVTRVYVHQHVTCQSTEVSAQGPGHSLEGNLGENISLIWLTSPYFQLREKLKWKEYVEKSKICIKTSIWMPLNFSLCESTSLSSDAHPGIVWVG